MLAAASASLPYVFDLAVLEFPQGFSEKSHGNRNLSGKKSKFHSKRVKECL